MLMGGGSGNPGDCGWTMVPAIVSDGARRVISAPDWVQAGQSKPVGTQYVGASGLVTDIAQAVDIRGPAGADGAPGATGATGSTGPAGPSISWTTINSSSFNFVAFQKYMVIPQVGGVTGTLPANPNIGDEFTFAIAALLALTNLTVARNGNTINGLASNLVTSLVGGTEVKLVCYAANTLRSLP